MRSLAFISVLLCACVTPPLLTCPIDQDYCNGLCVAKGSCLTSTCTAPLTDCGGACVDLSSSAAHCGACDNACRADAMCVAAPGGPTCACNPGLTGATCSTCTMCSMGHYVVAGCTPVNDTQCAACQPIPNCTQLVCTGPGSSTCLACLPGFIGPSCLPAMAAGPDCSGILLAMPGAPDGLYLVDPDGPGPLPAFQTYCDMTNGGWTLINDQDVNVAPGYQPAATWRTGVSTTAPNGGQWGVLNLAPAFASANMAGGFEMRLTFGQTTTTNFITWRQAGDPTSNMRGALVSSMGVPDSQQSCSGPFAGLANDGVLEAALDGESSCGLWFAVGTSAAVGGGIPAYSQSAAGALTTDRVRLWIRIFTPA